MVDEPVLIDTSALLALYNSNDSHHQACRKQSEELPLGKAFTCWPVITEAVYMLRNHPAERDHLLKHIQEQEFLLLPCNSSDVREIRAIFKKYHDHEVDLADATLVHLAERENIPMVFTLDRRHFHIYQTAMGRSLRLLPEVL